MRRSIPIATRPPAVLAALAAITALLATTTPAHAQQRVWAADSFWIRMWVRGGTSEAELLVEPRHLAVTAERIVVLDLGTREVLGMDLATGRTSFHLRATGDGPGEFRRPAMLAPTRDGFLLLDHATSRLSHFDPAGRYRGSTPVTNGFAVESICAGGSGAILLKLMGARHALHTIAPGGRQVEVRSLPWPDPGTESMRSTGVLAGASASAACAFLPLYGSEWLIVPRTGAVAARRYVRAHGGVEVRTTEGLLDRSITGKRLERTQIVDGEPAVIEAFAVGDTVIVRDGGDRASGYRILDYYLLPSGRYLHSRRVPPGFTRLAAAAGGTFIGAHIGEEVSSLVAMRATATPPARRAANPAAASLPRTRKPPR